MKSNVWKNFSRLIRIIQKYRVPVPRYSFGTVPVPRYYFSKVPSTVPTTA